MCTEVGGRAVPARGRNGTRQRKALHACLLLGQRPAEAMHGGVST
jgi:hypothetical protein